MPFERRDFTGNAVQTTLASGVGTGDTTIVITDPTGWPTGATGPFFGDFGYDPTGIGTSIHEKWKATGRTGSTITGVTRGVDGTSAASHSTGEKVRHIFTAIDADEANAHYADTALDHHCFSEDTEVLTAEGWLGIDALEPGVLTWSFDLATEQAALEPIQAVFRYPAADFPELLALENQDMGTLLVTPDHTMVWRRPHHEWRTRPASTLPKIFFLPAFAAGTDRVASLPDELIQLVAWAATEGCWQEGRMVIAQKEGPTADRIRGLLIALDIPYGEYKQRVDMRLFRVHSPALSYYLDADKVPRRDLLAMSPRQARLFLGDAVLGDGHTRGDKLAVVEAWQRGEAPMNAYLASINERFMDWCQELCVLNGIKSRIYPETRTGCYRLAIKQSRNHTGVKVTPIPNDGPVWCVSVPERRTLIVRRPGSAPVITGNTQYLNTTRHDVEARHTFGAAYGTPAIPEAVSATAASAGSGNNPAREDHAHLLPVAIPRGELGYAERTSSLALTTSEQVVTSVAVTTALNNRKVRVTGSVKDANGAGGATQFSLSIRRSGGSNLKSKLHQLSGGGDVVCRDVITTAATIIYELVSSVGPAGTGNIVSASSNEYAHILVEDIGGT